MIRKSRRINKNRLVKNILNLKEFKSFVRKKESSSFPVVEFLEQHIKSFPDDYLEFLSINDLLDFIFKRYLFVKSKVSVITPDDIEISVLPDPGETWIINAHTIELILYDMAFIKNSMIELIQARGYRIRYLVSNILNIAHDANRNLSLIGDTNAKQKFYYAFVILERHENFKAGDLSEEIGDLFRHIRLVTRDFRMMATKTASKVKQKNIQDFFSWLARDNFLFFGIYDSADKLGLFQDADYYRMIRRVCSIKSNEGLHFIKTRQISKINRRENIVVIRYMDLVISGIFTRKADNSSSTAIPFLSDKLNSLIKMNRDYRSSIDVRDFIYAFDLLPLIYRFIIPMEGFIDFSELLFNARLSIEGKARMRSFKKGELFLLIIWPIAEITEEFYRRARNYIYKKGFKIEGEVSRFLSSVGWFFYELSESADGSLNLLKNEEFEMEIISELMGWERKFHDLAEAKFPFETFQNHRKIMASIVESDYREKHSPSEGVGDMQDLKNSFHRNRIIRGGYDTHFERSFVKIFLSEPYNLGYFIPIFSNLGLSVIAEDFHKFYYEDKTLYLYIFIIQNGKESIKDREVISRICEAVDIVMEQKASSEPLNSLILNSNLTIYQLELLKALLSYLFQIKKGYSRVLLKKMLENSPDLASAIVGTFELKFLDIISKEGALYAFSEKIIRRNIREYPAEISKVAEFRKQKKLKIKQLEVKQLIQKELLQTLTSIIKAIVRTNYFLDEETIAFKISSKKISFIPQPCPLFEIFVYHAHFEGIHLRGGKISRGGIRWSDRPDDFRTEIMGLWKTQVLKNTIIVPTGAKGGFVLKYISSSRENAVEMYKKFIEVLISLTDNRADNRNVKNASIPVIDDEDTYLVVAADKGTSAFSDYANEISVRKKFWLGDAFASGGKNGYAHKALGITALGAWESARWHFYKTGKDPTKDPFTVIGIGDMSGDVFGNGLIYSDKIKLTGAFNHKYIFLDAEPDMMKSFIERKKLFLEAGDWSKYDTKNISAGGGIFERDSASIKLSARTREVLGTSAEKVTGEELIKILLKAPVDMIFNGGVGTYIKASEESDGDVDDLANDPVRIDASSVRAKMIIEGGNLGVSQAGRIEYSLKGGLINTDAIDNSAGVDLSDHEVNLKILFSIFMEHGLIKDEAHRNQRLKQLAGDEAHLVLKNNFRQNWALVYLHGLNSRESVFIFDLMNMLKSEKLWSDTDEGIRDRQILKSCIESESPIPAPLIARMHSLTKLYLEHKYVTPQNVDIYREELVQYFPRKLSGLKELFLKHPLKNEIIKTMIVNKVADYAGFPYVVKCLKYLELDANQMIEYYIHASKMLGIEKLKINKYMPDMENRKLPVSVPLELTLAIKNRIEKSIYRYIELLVLFQIDLQADFSLELPLLPEPDLQVAEIKMIEKKLSSEEAAEIYQLSHVGFRFGFKYLVLKRDAAYYKKIINAWHNYGILELKKELYNIIPGNHWEIQSHITLKKLFWSGFFKCDPEKLIESIEKLNLIHELNLLRHNQNINLSTMSGIVGYLFAK
ncbi:MAG: NAD-glutamate dehydrogenase [Spirochaetia bacterium]|nr:NAD-glutamate dehydrogenase [Spirochaetia bacterium]